MIKGLPLVFQKCFEAKALPEWVLRYFSKSDAFPPVVNAKKLMIRQGAYLEVRGTLPLLWTFRRDERSWVIPLYCLSGSDSL